MIKADLDRPALVAKYLRRELGKNRLVAVDDVSLKVLPGQVVCLLGPNGAGKTTTIKMCSTLLTPTSGVIEVAGIDAVAKPNVARERLGLVLGGEKGFYLRASAQDNLLFFADVANVPRHERRSSVQYALEAVSLTDRATSKVQDYSRGMRQRLHIARALLNRPKLLLLDEPTNGLDPEIALEMRKLVRILADQGVGILLTTHYLAEAETLSDRLLVLQKGQVQIDGSASDISVAAGISKVTTFSLTRSALEVSGVLNEIHPQGRFNVDALHSRTHVRLIWSSEDNFDLVVKELFTRLKEKPSDMVTRPPTLEESYLTLLSISDQPKDTQLSVESVK